MERKGKGIQVCELRRGGGGGRWASPRDPLHLYYSLPREFFSDFVQGDEIEFGTVDKSLLVVEAFVGLAAYRYLASQGVRL
jgi:hypothetical protein